MITTLQSLPILDGPPIIIAFVLAFAALGYLLARRPSVSWLITAGIGIVGGAVVAIILFWLLSDVLNTFGMPLEAEVGIWAAATFAAIGVAIVNLWRSRWWRKVVAGIGIVLFVLAGTLGINSYYGLNPTVGSLFGTTTQPTIALAAKDPVALAAQADTRPLWMKWKPPADMPKLGEIGTHDIPATLSGFHARPAGVYLPPAALVKNPPLLPVVVLMMGQPGNPDPSYVQSVLDEYASQNQGLAPIVVVADQLGNPSVDPACSNSVKYGNVETYITQDVVDWITANLPVIKSPRAWTVAGYSNGGACALTYAAKYPNIWGNVLDISGEEFPGAEHPARTLRDIFRGDQARYDKQMPAKLFAAHKYPNMVGVFTVGSNDLEYVKHVTNSYDAAKAAGVKATLFEVPNGGHVLGALMGGLREGFQVLYPVTGLTEPASEMDAFNPHTFAWLSQTCTDGNGGMPPVRLCSPAHSTTAAAPGCVRCSSSKS